MFHDSPNTKLGSRDNVGDDRSWATPMASSIVECDLLKNPSGTEIRKIRSKLVANIWLADLLGDDLASAHSKKLSVELQNNPRFEGQESRGPAEYFNHPLPSELHVWLMLSNTAYRAYKTWHAKKQIELIRFEKVQESVYLLNLSCMMPRPS